MLCQNLLSSSFVYNVVGFNFAFIIKNSVKLKNKGKLISEILLNFFSIKLLISLYVKRNRESIKKIGN